MEDFQHRKRTSNSQLLFFFLFFAIFIEGWATEVRNNFWLPYSTTGLLSQNLIEIHYILKGKKKKALHKNSRSEFSTSVKDKLQNMQFLRLSVSLSNNNNPTSQLVSSLLIRQVNTCNYKVTIFKEKSNPFFIHW